MATVHDLHPDALHRCETALRLLLAQTFPDTRQALRAAVTANGANAGATPPAAPECATPRGGSDGAPNAIDPFTAAPSAGHRNGAMPPSRLRWNSAQRRALSLWHGRTPQKVIAERLASTPRFPLIDGVATPRPFAPVRARPRAIT